MPYLKKQFNWFEEICYGLPEEPDGALWSTGDEILCRTEEAANAIANLIESMYKAQGEDVLTITGYYDPEEDERNGEVDRYTGWWYVYI